MRSIFTLSIFSLFLNSVNAQIYDTLNFEVTPLKVGIDSINGCWQIGTPSKIIFDSAYSTNRAIVTDTLNPYPDSTFSTFEISFPVTTFSAFFSLKYTHKYDTEYLKDGGYIQMYDCWTSQWVNLFSGSMVMSCTSPYGGQFNGAPPTTTLFNGEKGYTGNSGGWITDELYFPCMAVRSGGADSIKIRFVFVSDNVTTGHEGWMLDNFVFTDHLGMCSSIDENQLSRNFKSYPNPVNNEITLESTSTEMINTIDILNTQGELLYSSKVQQTNQVKLNLGFLNSGIYLIRLNSNNYNGYFVKE